MTMEDAVEKASKRLEEKKWLIGLGKPAGVLTAAILAYYQAKSVIDRKTEHVDNKAEAGYGEMVATLKELQAQRIAERKAYTDELATLRRMLDGR